MFLLVSGWIIVLGAVALLRPGPLQSGFALGGAGIEGVGLVLLFRAHIIIAPRDDR